MIKDKLYSFGYGCIIAFMYLMATLVASGCASSLQTQTVDVPEQTVRSALSNDILCWSDNLRGGAVYWLLEARTRFKDPFIFVVHGDSGSRNAWMTVPDNLSRRSHIEAVAGMLHDLMPDRDIVLISCNEGAVPFEINIPRVYYARKPVWSYPWWASEKARTNKQCVSSIWDFTTEGKPLTAVAELPK